MNLKTCVARERFKFNGKTGSLSLFAPIRVKEGGYICWFEVSGLPDPLRPISVGIDSFQALYRALSEIVSYLSVVKIFPVDQSGRDWTHSFLPIWIETEFFGSKLIKDLEFDRAKYNVGKPTKYWQSFPKITAKKKKQTQNVLASRKLLFKNQIIDVELFVPEKRKAPEDYFCDYQFVGLSRPKSTGSYGSSAFQSLYLAYFFLCIQLTSLGSKLTWPLAPDGQLGFPALFLTNPSEAKMINKNLTKIIYKKILKKRR